MDLDYIPSREKEVDINSINSTNLINSNLTFGYLIESNKKQKIEENKINDKDSLINKSEILCKNESSKISNSNNLNENNNNSIQLQGKSQFQYKDKLKEINLNLITNEEEDFKSNNNNKKISLNLDQEILKKDLFPLFDYNNSSNLLLIKDNIITAIGDINSNNKHKFIFLNENLLNKSIEYTITINKINSWFAIGAAYLTIVQRNKFDFKGIPYRQHGCILISFNKGLTFSWNCFKQEQNNNTLNNFALQIGDAIKMKYNPEEGSIHFNLKNFNSRLRGIKLYERYQLKPCLILTEAGDQVEIIKSL